MNEIRVRRRRASFIMLCTLAVAAWLSMPAARAESVLAAGSVFGGKQMISTELHVDTAGRLTVQVTDLGVPMSIVDRLNSLSFGITNGGAVLGSWDETGAVHLDLHTPGTYMMFLACVPGGRFNLGLVSWNVVLESFETPVPLPATFWLLIAGVAWAIGMQRHRARLARGEEGSSLALSPGMALVR